jgi:hypothetical protein
VTNASAWLSGVIWLKIWAINVQSKLTIFCYS